MNTQAKVIISAAVFVVFMVTAFILYKSISADYGQSSDSSTLGEENYGTIDAPDFSVLDADGNTVRLSDYIGRPVVLNFWASWCGPCRNEMPHFDKAYQTHGDEVVFLMIDLVDGGRETIESGKAFIEENGYSFTIFFDTKNEAAAAYSITSIPTTLFINREGKIVKFKNRYGYIVSGYQGAIDKATLESCIELIK